MELYEKQITIKIPKIDFFFVNMTLIFIAIGAAAINLIQGFSTGDTPFFSIETSFVMIGVSTLFFFMRVMEESPLQKTNGLFQQSDDDYEHTVEEPDDTVYNLPAIAERQTARDDNSIGGILNRVDEQHENAVDEQEILQETLRVIQEPERQDEQKTDEQLMHELKTSLTKAVGDEFTGPDGVSEVVSEIEKVVSKKVA